MKYEVCSWYLLGALLGAATALAGTAVALSYIEANTPTMICPPVTLPGEVAVEAPESAPKALETEVALEVIQEQDQGVVPSSPRLKRPRPRLDINLDSNDPLEGIQ